MGFKNKFIACLLIIMSAFTAVANAESVREILLQDIETLAVDKPLRYDNGEPVAVIDTGVIADTLGRVARGPHTFEFRLEETAPFAVMVRGERVEPGATLNFVENLTTVNSRLVLPIYPAELGVGGKAKFELDLPELYIRACPVGYTEGESDCFKITYDEMIFICPTTETTYRTDTEDCRGIRVTPSIPYCDAPFELSNGTCVHTFTTYAYENCPSGSGWSISGDTCKYYEQQPIQSCPAGYTKSGNLCYQVIDKSERCPSGYTNTGSVCEKDESSSATPVCPSGYSLSGTTCSKSESRSATPYCSSGYSLSGTTCSKSESKSATANCPAGYSLSGSSCNKTESTSATATCPSGYTRSGSSCNKTETKSASASCPSGYSRSGSSCTRTESQSASTNCPSGYSKYGSNQCRKTSTYTATTTKNCSSGYTYLNDGRCNKYEYYVPNPSSASCPKSGWTVRVVSGFGVEELQCFSGNYADVGNNTGPANFSCSSGYSKGRGGCYRNTYKDPLKTCPSGGTLSGSTCTKTSTTSATYSCPSGYSRSGTTCTRVRSQSVSYSCSSGYSLSGSSCSRTLTQSVSYTCPSGYSRSGTTCTRVLSQGASYSCSSGYTLSGSTCSRTLTQSASYSCPSGYTRSGTTCSRVLTQSASHTCSSGWSLNGTTCERTLTDSIDYYCETGTRELNADSCYENDATPSVGNCPSGSTLNPQTGACEIKDSEPVVYTCPTENGDKYTLQGSDCHYADMKAASTKCTGDAELIDDGASCELHLTEEAIPSCEEEGYIPLVSENRCMKDERVPFGQ
jgi:hypothetical protein